MFKLYNNNFDFSTFNFNSFFSNVFDYNRYVTKKEK